MKKLTAALLSMALLAGAAAMPAAAAESYSMGDVDMNGVVNTADAMLVLREYIDVQIYKEEASLSDAQYALGDVWKFDDSATVMDTMDAIGILRYYVYTIVADSPVASEEFFANYTEFLNETEQAENLQDASEQAIEEGQNAIDELQRQ